MLGIGIAIVSSYLLYYFKVTNKVVTIKIISAHKAYHSVNRRRWANLRRRSNSFEVNKAGVLASNTKLIGRYKKLKTGKRSKLVEEIQEAKVGTVSSKG